MFTGTPDYIRHYYRATNELKSYTVFKLSQVAGSPQLTDILRIELFNGKSNASNISEYLRLRTSTSWDKSLKVTGLRFVKDGLFYGDYLKPNPTGGKTKTLLVFRFANARQMLIIDVYRGFYPNHNGILQTVLNANRSVQNLALE